MPIMEPSILAGGPAWEKHLRRLEKLRSESPDGDLDEAIRRASAMVDLGYLRMPADEALGEQLLREIARARGPTLAYRMDPTLPLPKRRRPG